MKIKTKHLKYGAVATIALIFTYLLYYIFLSPTKIAMINFPAYQVSNMQMANKNDYFIEVDNISPKDADKLDNYDAILMFGPGLRISNDENEAIEKARAKGAFIYSSFFHSNAIKGTKIDSIKEAEIQAYFSNRSTNNYRNLALYIRYNFDKYKLFSKQAKPAHILPDEMFYHLDKEKYFTTAKDLVKHLKDNNLYKENAQKIAFCSGTISPMAGNRAYIDSMIVAMSNAGYNVFPICSGSDKRLSLLKEVQPDAVVYFPMGRLARGDKSIDWLSKYNIPLFCPFPMLQTHDEWLTNVNGQTGGGLTARIVLAELDGGICPLAISTENEANGLYTFNAEPERVNTLISNMQNYLALRKKNNDEKRIVIVYFKGVGQTSLHATHLEVAPSLYNLLKRLKEEGYKVEDLPNNEHDFENMLKREGKFYSNLANGAINKYLRQAKPKWINKSEYSKWIDERINATKYKEVVEEYGVFPGSYMSKGDSLAIPILQFGNIVLMPQLKPAFQDDDFKVAHGVDVPPPHSYIAQYLWAQQGFKADALIHFGTHGNLEFIPGKQTALTPLDWSDALIGSMPHFYYYSIANVGESIIAKRRTHATIISHITPPFKENKTNNQFTNLFDAIDEYHQVDESLHNKIGLKIKALTVKLGLHKDLKLNGDLSKPYSHDDIEYIESYAAEITNEKMVGKLYTLGKKYSKPDIISTSLAISADPLAYCMARKDMLEGKISRQEYENNSFISKKYLYKIQKTLRELLNNPNTDTIDVYRAIKLSKNDIAKAKSIKKNRKANDNKKKWANNILEIKEAADNVINYKNLLEQSPQMEMQSLLNALNGSYIRPSAGGDAVLSPNTLPTGRNLFSINTEATPSKKAYENGMRLANSTLEQYKKKHGRYPKKVSYTFWSGSFIESEGATIAQILYMLGVEPMYDMRKRVVDLRLIPSSKLGRPRIDIVVQVSGQLRDLAASRLFLITKAIAMTSSLEDEEFPNYVKEGTLNMEKELTQKGYSFEDARELSIMRVFGGLNGRYGTGIMDLVEKGNAWDSKSQITDTYMNNMGALYSDEEHWGDFNKDLFRTALSSTDVVVQPRQNNTWGALSLDHVYEFMGGMNLSVNEVTGKAPETYFADYRNRHRIRLQELKEAVGIESRVTLLNKEYIKEKIKGGAGSAETFAKTIRNTYGWNVMKSDLIDNELWDKLYEVYIKDIYQLEVHKFFEAKNPEALQEISAVMLETARKGMWTTKPETIKEIADLHSKLVNKYGASGSYFTDNDKLQQFIKSNISNAEQAKQYDQQIKAINELDDDAIVLEKDNKPTVKPKISHNKNILFIVLTLIVLILLAVILKARRK